MTLVLAGVDHGVNEWQATKHIIDELRQRHKLGKITIEAPKEFIRKIGVLPEIPEERALEYFERVCPKALSQVTALNPIADNIKLKINDYVLNRGTKTKLTDLVRALKGRYETKEAKWKGNAISSMEYARLLIKYCESNKIELVPIGKFAYRQFPKFYGKSLFKSTMAQALLEKELAREIKNNNALLNIVGRAHVIPISFLLKKSGVPVKVVFSNYKKVFAFAAESFLFGHLPLALRKALKKTRTKILVMQVRR